MGSRQTEFLERFKLAFESRILGEFGWATGQVSTNTAQLTPVALLRRGGAFRPNEVFEIGDLRCDLPTCTVIVEYESDAISIHNLLKYWPYLRGEMTKKPALPIVLCHFSNWYSYGSHRDLWGWLYLRMMEDPSLIVPITARQFDHWAADVDRSARAINEAVDWIEELASQGEHRGS